MGNRIAGWNRRKEQWKGGEPAEPELDIWELAGSEGLYGKAVNISARLRVTQLPQSLYTGVDEVFDDTSTQCSYIVRFL